MPGALDVDDDCFELIDSFGGNNELILQESGRAVGAVPLPEHVQRMVELRQILNLAPVGSRLAVPEFPDRAEGVLIGEPVREDVRKCK